MGGDLQRAVYYPPTDLACMMSKGRVQRVLEGFPKDAGTGINNAKWLSTSGIVRLPELQTA